MKAVVSLLFGPLHNPHGWAGEEDLSAIPLVGQAITVDFDNAPVPPVQGQVYRTWSDSNTRTASILIYAGPQPPEGNVPEGLLHSGWEPLSTDTLTHLARVVEETPVIAAVHDVVLAVGDIYSEDKDVYRRRLQPLDPVLPLVGQRLLLEAADDTDDTENSGNADGLAAFGSGSEEEPDIDIDAYLMHSEPLDVTAHGLPAVAVHASELQRGEARILMWTPTLGNLPEKDLLDNGWVKTSPKDRCLMPDFRLTRRIELALFTHLTLTRNEFSSVVLGEWFITRPDDVTAEDRDLLPVLLWEHTHASKEMRELENFLDNWQDPPQIA